MLRRLAIVGVLLLLLVGRVPSLVASEAGRRQIFVEIVNYLQSIEYSITVPPRRPYIGSNASSRGCGGGSARKDSTQYFRDARCA
jgi:hypothetical protein